LKKVYTLITRYITPYDRAWDMGSYTEYMTVYDGICQVVRIPDANMHENMKKTYAVYAKQNEKYIISRKYTQACLKFSRNMQT
jgi:hypothetical protein